MSFGSSENCFHSYILGIGFCFNIIGIILFCGSDEMIIAGVFLDTIADTLGSVVVMSGALIILYSDWHFR